MSIMLATPEDFILGVFTLTDTFPEIMLDYVWLSAVHGHAQSEAPECGQCLVRTRV